MLDHYLISHTRSLQYADLVYSLDYLGVHCHLCHVGLCQQMFHHRQTFYLPCVFFMHKVDFSAQHIFWSLFCFFHSPRHHTYVYFCQAKVLTETMDSKFLEIFQSQKFSVHLKNVSYQQQPKLTYTSLISWICNQI